MSLRLKRPRRHVSAAGRERQPAAGAPNELWSMDFVSDALFDGRRLRALTVVDAYTREALTIEVDQGINGEQVVDAVTRIAVRRGAPRTIRVDNGPEFVSKALDRWAYENAGARFIQPRVATPALVDDSAVLIGGVELAANVRVGPGTYLHAGDAPAISVGANTTIGSNTSVHELTFTSTRIGANAVIGNRVVLHGPLQLGDGVQVGDGTVLFGPKVAANVTIGKNVCQI